MFSLSFFAHFFSLFSVCSLWLFEKRYFALLSIGIGVICALITNVISQSALFIIVIYFLANYLFYKKQVSHFASGVLAIIIFAIAWMLSSHLVPGFISWQIIYSEILSPDAEKFSLYLNMDKVIAGMGIMVFGFIPLRRSIQIRHMIITMLPASILCILLISITALVMKVVNFDPKFPDLWITWILISLLVHSFAEEVIFRYFLQGGIQNILITYKYSPLISILVSSTAFTFYQAPQPTNFLISVFIASLFFAYVFHKTKRVESSILLHFMVNFVHFFFFTYPSLG